MAYDTYNSAGDLAFNSEWELLLTTNTGYLIQIDRSTGAITTIGSIPDVGVFAFDRNSLGDMYGINAINQILSINPATGAGTYLGDVITSFDIGDVWGGSFINETIPVPISCAVLLGILGLSIAGMKMSKFA